MKKILYILIGSILLMSCKKEKVFLIQASNYNQNGIKAFYGCHYRIDENGKEILRGVLDKDEHTYVNLKMNEYKNYVLTVLPNNNVSFGDKYKHNYIYDINLNTKSVFIKYALSSILLLSIEGNGIPLNIDSQIVVKKKWLWGKTDDESKEEIFYVESLEYLDLEKKENMNEGEYEISWDINLDGTISSFKDTIQLTYGDTTNYTINY